MIKIPKSKFNVDTDKQKRTYNNILFDSVLELKFYRDVILPQVGSGDIVEYELQKPYELQKKFVHDGQSVRAITYVADFWVKYADGHEVVFDTKGVADSSAKLKRKLFWYAYPDIDYQWVSYSAKDGGWIDYDKLQKLRRERKKNKENT